MQPDHSPRYHWMALALIVATAVLRLLYLAFFCPLDLSPDEAYYWEWSRQLDWSYHSKGPLVAWLIRASCALLGDTMFAVRLPAVVCGSLLLGGLYVLTLQVHRNGKLAFAVVALALTLPIVAAGSLLITIDAPFTCTWTWALVFVQRAVFRRVSWAWFAAGMCLLLGMLAKHTMILWVPSFALFLATSQEYRPLLVKPGFWLMSLLSCAGGLPIVLWNAANGWVTLGHTQAHAGFGNQAFIRWLGPLNFLGAQFAVLIGFWFILWAVAMWRHRPTVATNPEQRFLWWMSAPTFLFFGLFAFKNGGGEANWPVAGYLSGLVLAAGWVGQTLGEQSTWRRSAFVVGVPTFATVGLLISVGLHEPILVQPVLMRLAGPASSEQPTPLRRVDPTCRLRGWQQLAVEVDDVRSNLRSRGIEPVLAAGRWTQAAELSFYGDGKPTVYCLGTAQGDRDSQYDLWRPNPIADGDAFRKRTFILVGVNLRELGQSFQSFEAVRTVQHRQGGCLIASWEVVVAHGFRGLPRRELGLKK